VNFSPNILGKQYPNKDISDRIISIKITKNAAAHEHDERDHNYHIMYIVTSIRGVRIYLMCASLIQIYSKKCILQICRHSNVSS
jgi:hypothetical protein